MGSPERILMPHPAGPQHLRRLGKNVNGYFGETIDLDAVLRDCAAAATRCGWTSAAIPVNERVSLPVYIRPGPVTDPHERYPRIYISAGIHGDEPAGPLAIRHLLEADAWPAHFGLWLCPCLNPAGFELNQRENAEGLDLNRQYLRPRAAETVAHIAWLTAQPSFDLCLCLHEDWESHGFYVYELNPEHRPSMAADMVRQVSCVCPVDLSELIEGRPARNGIIRPTVDPRERPDWPESFYLLTCKTRLSYTLEAPSDFVLGCRVAALETGVRAALGLLERQSRAAGHGGLEKKPSGSAG